MKLTRLFRRGATAVAVLLAFLMSAPAAQAYLGPQTATTPGFVGINGKHEIGTMGLSFYNNARFVCIDESGGTAGFMDTPHSATAASDVQNWAAAYALSDRAGYLYSPADKKAAALDYYVGVIQNMNSNPSEVARAWNAAAAAGMWADSTAELAALVADVNANAGPYDMSRIALSKSGTGGGTVTDIGVQSAAGTWQAGYAVTLSLTGPGVFAATGTNAMTVTSATSPLTEAFTFTGPGTVKVRQATTGLPEMVAVHPAPGAGQQRVVAEGALGIASGTDPVDVTAYAPKATSTVSSQLVAAGSQVTDTVLLTGGVPNGAFSGTVDVYGPLATHPKDGIPAGTVPATTLTYPGTFAADGTGKVITSPVTLPKPGFVYFHEKVDATADYAAYTAPLGKELSETVLVMAPELVTQASAQTVSPGSTLTDTVASTGSSWPVVDVNGDPISYTVSGVILASSSCSGPWDPSAPVFSFGPVAFTPGQPLTTGSWTVPASVAGQCVTYSEVTSWSAKSGTGHTAPTTPGLATESAQITDKGGAGGAGAYISTGAPTMTTVPAPGVWAGSAAVMLGALLGLGLLVTRKKGARA